MIKQMHAWLEDAAKSELDEDAFGFLMGRGASRQDITDIGWFTWTPPDEPAPCETYRKRYGAKGQLWDGWIVSLIRGPDGSIQGASARSLEVKMNSIYKMPYEPWQPFLWGCHQAVRKAWAGGDLWVTEGAFDAHALGWVVPPHHGRVAVQRARLSSEHVMLFQRLGCHVHLVLDMDKAGREGTERATWGLKKAGVRHTAWRYGMGKDPGEIWDNYGVDGLRQQFGAGMVRL